MPEISQRKLSRMTTKLWNSQKCSPSKVCCYTVVVNNKHIYIAALYSVDGELIFQFCYKMLSRMSCAYICLESQFTLHTHSVRLSLSQVTPFLPNWLVSVGKDNLKYVCNQVLGACKTILSVSVHVWTNLVPQQYSTCIQWVHYPGFSTLDKCLHFAQTSFSTMSFAVWDTICFWKKKKKNKSRKK